MQSGVARRRTTWVASVLVLLLVGFGRPARTQGRPDIQWMLGGIGAIRSTAYSPDGTALVTGSLNGTVILWDAGSRAMSRTLVETGSPIYSVAYSPDGTTVAAGSSDGLARLWRVSDGVLIRTMSGAYSPKSSLAFSPDGDALAGGGAGNAVLVWRMADGSVLMSLSGRTGDIS